jgi:hypothetical protein
MPKPVGNTNRIDALRKREAALRAAIAMEKVRQQKKDHKDDCRVQGIIGEVLVRHAAQHSDLELMIKSILGSDKSLTDTQIRLLQERGWRS